MAITHRSSKKKPSGGKIKSNKKKKLFEIGNLPTLTRIGEKKIKTIRGKGGNTKTRLFKVENVNVLDIKTKKFQVVKIDDVLENPANRHYVRRDIVTKGTIIKTKLGNAKVTSRPAQDGTVNAILIK